MQVGGWEEIHYFHISCFQDFPLWPTTLYCSDGELMTHVSQMIYHVIFIDTPACPIFAQFSEAAEAAGERGVLLHVLLTFLEVAPEGR